jgi:hypothetical protein
VLSGAAAEIGKEGGSLRQLQGEEKSSQERAYRPDMDDSDTDLDVQIPMYSINDPANYVNVQAAAQNQGLQRRHDFQERALTSGEEELRLNSEAVGREAERRRGVEEKWSRVQEVRRNRQNQLIQKEL